MEESKNKKTVERQNNHVKDLEYMDDFYAYNPFGRGGGGAPLRDQTG